MIGTPSPSLKFGHAVVAPTCQHRCFQKCIHLLCDLLCRAGDLLTPLPSVRCRLDLAVSFTPSLPLSLRAPLRLTAEITPSRARRNCALLLRSLPPYGFRLPRHPSDRQTPWRSPRKSSHGHWERLRSLL